MHTNICTHSPQGIIIIINRKFILCNNKLFFFIKERSWHLFASVPYGSVSYSSREQLGASLLHQPHTDLREYNRHYVMAEDRSYHTGYRTRWTTCKLSISQPSPTCYPQTPPQTPPIHPHTTPTNHLLP